MRKRDVNFEKLIEIFNRDGKEAAITFVEDTYGTTYEVIQRRIKKETNYFYNRNTKKYEFKAKIEPNFMTIEELYEGNSKSVIPADSHVQKVNEVSPISDDFKELMLNLMKDKMQELNKYVYLEQSTKQVIIQLQKLERNGYKVIIN